MDFNFQLKQLRLERGYTQEQLATISNISVQTIRNYEQGRCKPNCDYLLVLAAVLDVTPELLLKGTNDMNNYTTAIMAELKQLSYEQISIIKKECLNSTILAHLELSDDFVDKIRKDWLDRKIFEKKNEKGETEEHSCYRNYVREIIIRFCQNRSKYKEIFKLNDGFLSNIKVD